MYRQGPNGPAMNPQFSQQHLMQQQQLQQPMKQQAMNPNMGPMGPRPQRPMNAGRMPAHRVAATCRGRWVARKCNRR